MWLNVYGVLLAGAAVAWGSVAAGASGGDPAPSAWLIIAAVVCVFVGVLVGSWNRALIPAAVVGFAAVIALANPNETISSYQTVGPLAYGNAKSALFVQAAIAGLMLWASAKYLGVRFVGLLAALAFALIPFASRSFFAEIVVLALPGLVILSRLAHPRRGVMVCGAVFTTALLTTVWLGAIANSAFAQQLAMRTSSERRTVLWHEAIEIMADRPVSGVGPGRFRLVAPTARADSDALWTHNGFLQEGAEKGVPGFVLAGLIFAWGFVRLGVNRASDAVTVLGAGALTALGVHATIDYVLHFPVVVLMAALLVGVGIASSRPASMPDASRERESLGHANRAMFLITGRHVVPLHRLTISNAVRSLRWTLMVVLLPIDTSSKSVGSRSRATLAPFGRTWHPTKW